MLRVDLPQREVARVLLLLVDLHARAFLELVEHLARQPAVARELGDLEVDVAVPLVGHALVEQIADDLPHLRDELGRARHVVRWSHVQLPTAVLEFRDVLLGDLPGGLAGLLRGRLHLVLAAFDVVEREVADVGDVHHLGHLVAPVLEEAPQHVGEQEAAEVADVR